MNPENSRFAQIILAQARDERADANQFRTAIHRLGLILAAQVMESAPRETHTINTPLKPFTCERLSGRIALVPVLRAGRGILPAFEQFIDNPLIWPIGLSRNEETLQTSEYGNEMPSVVPHDVKMTIILEVMVATGGSILHTVQALEAREVENIHVACILASPEGVKRIGREAPNVHFHCLKVDERLTGDADPWPNGFILPGLGDAGDRLYGPKPE